MKRSVLDPSDKRPQHAFNRAQYDRWLPNKRTRLFGDTIAENLGHLQPSSVSLTPDTRPGIDDENTISKELSLNPFNGVDNYSLSGTDNVLIDLNYANVTLETNEICFGVLTGIQIRFRDDIHLDAFLLERDSNIATFELVLLNTHCDLIAPSGHILGVLNMQSYRVFFELQQAAYTWFAGLIDCSSWFTNDGSAIGNSLPRSYSIDVLIFGSRSQAEVVAKKLAANNLYLQDPDYIPGGFVYENPQCINFASIPQVEPCVGAAVIVPDGLTADKSHETLDDEFGVNYEKVVDLFACHNDLIQETAVAQVTSSLYSHQKEGLSFILQRESDSQITSRSLWEQLPEELTGDGAVIYKHVITGARSTDAKQSLGGIIADEMGLGKTLTMLSAITGTLDRAWHYAQTMTNIGTSGNGTIAAKSTLIIVPSALLIDTWIDEISARITPGALTYYKFHGYNRKIGYPQLLQHDIVFTTYGTVVAGFSRNPSPLHLIHWYRIVLDEAHVIRNASTKQFRAVTALKSLIRWGLTGTPIQNSLNDLGSLVKFLKVPILEEASQFKRHITSSIELRKSDAQRDYKLLQILLGSICLRRTKTVLPVTDITEETRLLAFSTDEQIEYLRIKLVCKEALDLAIHGFKVKEAHQTVLETLLRLRLFCNHGNFYEESVGHHNNHFYNPDEVFSLRQQSGEMVCSYCSCDIAFSTGIGEPEIASFTTGQRAVCNDCIPIYEDAASKDKQSPICQSAHILTSAVANDEGLASFQSKFPSKIVALCADITAHKYDGKCIVFSFWKRSLDITGTLLEIKDIPFLRVDGSLPLSKRKVVLDQFKEQADIPVLLMTLGTGAVGLNSMSVANRVHLLEPQWNPSVERQAIGRVVRLDQRKPVTVIRYIMNKTVEMVI
ncbi:SNF2 family N-terminal domain-containing protein [Phaeosphaeriaceae sp. PMI808]|nr:SNF2 family N-terminal domain-containing protein [Phaeosphaeriaceae sp. PMI808]